MTTTTEPGARRTAPEELPAAERARLERAFSLPRTRFLVGIPVALVVLAWSMGGAEFNFVQLGEGAVNMGEFLSRLFPPDFSKLGVIVALLVETLQMAIVGTVLGAVLSLLVAFAAASNIAPGPCTTRPGG